MQLLVLGSGTSYGVPMIGCDCRVCRSSDARDKRTRASVLFRANGAAILIDTSTDLRAQALRHGLTHLDAVLWTHSHADHVHGIDDLRQFSAERRSALPAWADRHAADTIRASHAYIFNDHEFKLGWGIPRLDLRVIEEAVDIGGVTVTPVPLSHGHTTSLGYRIGRLAYLTDCSAIPDASYSLLEGLDTLVVGAPRHRPHPMHFTVEQAVAEARRIGPRRTVLTHIAHDLPHAETQAALPEGVNLAYDGMTLDVPD